MVIDDAFNPWGVKITRIEIKDLTPPPNTSETLAQELKADRDKKAEVLQAEGDKQSAI